MKRTYKQLTIILCSIVISACSSFQSDIGPGYTETGQASYYGAKHHLKKTASGELYKQDLNTAAHKKLPFGSRVKVINVKNGKSVTVRINDRGPFVRGRIIDLSRAAFGSIANLSQGVIDVRIEVVK